MDPCEHWLPESHGEAFPSLTVRDVHGPSRTVPWLTEAARLAANSGGAEIAAGAHASRLTSLASRPALR